MVMYRARVQYLLKSIFDVTAAIVIFYVIMQLRPVRSSVCADGYTVSVSIHHSDRIYGNSRCYSSSSLAGLELFYLSETGCLSPSSEFVFMRENSQSGMGVVVIAIRTRVS